MENTGEIYQGQNKNQDPQDQNVQHPPQTDNSTTSQGNKIPENSAENRLMSLGIILLAISLGITLVYFFSTSEFAEQITEFLDGIGIQI